ncbi:MFS transporter [Nonomuraea sp. NPDC049504]|uniref:MFS transporter n=1 Tax=Nonomuraea sp. NPDC049504 TaxID=3154729 RepID=UPI00342E4ED8
MLGRAAGPGLLLSRTFRAGASPRNVGGRSSPVGARGRGVRNTFLRDLIPDSGAAWILVSTVAIGSIGTGLFLAGGVLFYTRVVHLSAAEIGIGLSLAGLAATLAAVPAGALADRVGPRQFMVGLHATRVLFFALLAFVTNFWQFVFAVIAVTVSHRVAFPVNQALIGRIFEGHKRTQTMALIHSVRNVGLAVGAALSSVAMVTDTPIAYQLLILGNACSFIPMMYLISRLKKYEKPLPPQEKEGGPKVHPLRDVPYLTLAMTSGLLLLNDSLLFVALPLWITQHTEAPAVMVAVITFVNTVMTALGQVWWTRWTKDVTSAARGLLASGVLLAAATLVFAGAHFFGAVAASLLLVLGVIVFTAGENLHSAGSWQVSYDLSPEKGRSKALAVFHLGETTQDVIGPSLVTGLLITAGPVGWLGLAGIFLAAGGGAKAGVRWVLHSRRMGTVASAAGTQ